MKILLTLVALAGILVIMVPEAEARGYRSAKGRAYVGSYGTGGYKIYSNSPAIRYRHNLGRKFRYHHERPYPYYRTGPKYFTGSPYYRHRGYYRFHEALPYYGYECRCCR
jgi:hypothetical protein